MHQQQLPHFIFTILSFFVCQQAGEQVAQILNMQLNNGGNDCS